MDLLCRRALSFSLLHFYQIAFAAADIPKHNLQSVLADQFVDLFNNVFRRAMSYIDENATLKSFRLDGLVAAENFSFDNFHVSLLWFVIIRHVGTTERATGP